MRTRPRFTCRYSLDNRLDHELVTTFEKAKGALQDAFAAGTFTLGCHQEDGLPAEPWQAWVIYFAGLIFGASDALVTLVLHNLGREARIIERALYEYFTRAQYYISHKQEARLEFYAGPFRELQLLDELKYSKDSDRYVSLSEIAALISRDDPAVAEHSKVRERSFHQMVKAIHKTETTQEYAFYYRQQSQTPHGSILGMPNVVEFNYEGKLGQTYVHFNSRLQAPNWQLFFGLQHLVNFMVLLANEFPGQPPFDPTPFSEKWTVIGNRLANEAKTSQSA